MCSGAVHNSPWTKVGARLYHQIDRSAFLSWKRFRAPNHVKVSLITKCLDYTEEPEDERENRAETPSLSFSNTETMSSWMHESNMDADIHSYTKHSVLRRDEYFFRLWYVPVLFKILYLRKYLRVAA